MLYAGYLNFDGEWRSLSSLIATYNVSKTFNITHLFKTLVILCGSEACAYNVVKM